MSSVADDTQSQWPELFTKLKQALAKNKEHNGLITDIEEYVERLQLQQHRLESHLKANETEIKGLKADQSKKVGIKATPSIKAEPTDNKGAYAPAQVKQSVEDLVEQVARLKAEKEEMAKQKIAYEKTYNAEIEKLIRFKQTIQQHTEALSMKVNADADAVRRERDDLLFQNADDELNKAHLKTRLDEAIVQLHQLAELTEEQAKAIEWLKVHRIDEKENRPLILDTSIVGSSDTGDGKSEAHSERLNTKTKSRVASVSADSTGGDKGDGSTVVSPSSKDGKRSVGSELHSPKDGSVRSSTGAQPPSPSESQQQQTRQKLVKSLKEDQAGEDTNHKNIQPPPVNAAESSAESMLSPKSRQIKRVFEK